jgi:transposase-like protein
MECAVCKTECKRHGYDRKGNTRYQCRECKKTYADPRHNPLKGMYLPIEKAEGILKLLVKGNSVSSVSRITGVHIATILKLLVLAGERCEPRRSPKTGHRWSPQNRPKGNALGTLIQTGFTLRKREQCLERRKEEASHRLGSARLDPTAH